MKAVWEIRVGGEVKKIKTNPISNRDDIQLMTERVYQRKVEVIRRVGFSR